MTLRKAQEFAERALGPRAPLGELKAAAVVRVRVPENLLAPREWRPTLRRSKIQRDEIPYGYNRQIISGI